jgi:FkbM family methyltransferase
VALPLGSVPCLGLAAAAAGGRPEVAWAAGLPGGDPLFRSGPRGWAKPVSARVRLGAAAYSVSLRTRTELDVLFEIGLEDEYRPADRIAAKTIVDLGASVGLATLRLLSAHPGAEVIAVEADPSLIPRLRENVAGLPVKVVHAAIAATSGEREFYRSDMDSWASSLERTHGSQVAVRVPAVSLGELLDSAGLDRVDLLKMDVEGAEWELLAAGFPVGVAAIVGEIHGRSEGEPEDFIAALSQAMAVETISSEPGRATFLATRPPHPSDSRLSAQA